MRPASKLYRVGIALSSLAMFCLVDTVLVYDLKVDQHPLLLSVFATIGLIGAVCILMAKESRNEDAHN